MKNEIPCPERHTSKTACMLEELRNEQINTWFDLGIFIDRVRDRPPTAKFPGSANDFKLHIETGGIGLLTFFFTIDGISVEANKYARILKNIYPKTKIHYIAGEIYPEAAELFDSPFQKEIKEIDGFDNWPLYSKFFKEKLERGSESYNQLIGKKSGCHG